MLMLGVLLHALPAAAQSPQPARHDVLAAGPVSADSEWLYLARTTTKPGPGPNDPPIVQTQIYRRTLTKSFTPFGGPILKRIVAMTPYGGQVAVLTEDGGWMLQSNDGIVIGLPLILPEARLIDLASDRNGLYAVAKVLGGVARLADTAASVTPVVDSGDDTSPATSTHSQPATGPETQPSTTTRAATTTTGPTTATRPQYNAPETLVIVQYGVGGWQPVTDIPFEVARPLDTVSLAMLDGAPFLLVREAPEQIRLWRLDGRKWSEVGQARISATTRIARLIAGGPKPTVWLSPAVESPAEPDHLLVFDAAGLGVTRSIRRNDPATTSATRPATGATTTPSAEVLTASGLANDMHLTVTSGIAPNMRSAAYAFNYFRSITFADDVIIDQAFDAVTFAAVESPRKQTVSPPGLDYFKVIQYALVAAAMAFAIVSSLRRRSELMALELDPDDLPLAPLGTRLLAGTIDATPFIASLLYKAYRYGADVDGQYTTESNIIVSVGFAVYFFVTLLTEVFAGRSLGKMACGLRVITVAGSTASRGQLATRNVLRIIDVVLQGLPLLLVPFSPLRQRAGDAAAGTIVVTAAPTKPAEEEPVE